MKTLDNAMWNAGRKFVVQVCIACEDYSETEVMKRFERRENLGISREGLETWNDIWERYLEGTIRQYPFPWHSKTIIGKLRELVYMHVQYNCMLAINAMAERELRGLDKNGG